MSVYTTDVLIEGVRRDDVLTWLADPAHHELILAGAWGSLKSTGTGSWEVTVPTQLRTRPMTYTFEHVDEDHGGRRVHVALGGKRTNGKLHWSLRTQKPSTNTLVTLHADIDAGGPMGLVAEQLGMRVRLEQGFRTMTENVRKGVLNG
ncbi:MAG: hypothetical protein EXR69_13700 [Myxococcales bacterium]|nr:hypothetical protein [Myxococcales bacterium]